MKRTLQCAARACGGNLEGADGSYGAVSTDSRTLPAGALFVALRGPNFDGAEFAAAAAQRGASGLLLERPLPVALPQIIVPDSLRALQGLSRAWRDSLTLPVVAVAGSNGKTTTKEMIAAVLRRTGPCLATQGNLNNHIGVPLTLLRLDASYASAVIEMGANRLGDVAQLMRFTTPTVAIITNAGAEHLEFFGSLDAVAQGEGEAIADLAADAAAVINADDAYANYWRGLAAQRRIVTFALSAPADYTARDVVQGVEGGEFVTRFQLVCPLGEREITVHAAGAHNVRNALGAAAAAGAAGATLEHIAAGLATFRAVAGRLQLKAGMRGSHIIDDSYNANPSSVRAGLDVLRTLPGRTWLVLGEMAELGAHSEDSHADVGAYARSCGVERLFAIGSMSVRAVEAFGAGAEWFADAESLLQRLQADISSGLTVLVKGSRVNRLERIVQALTGGGATGWPPLMRAG